MKLITLKKLMNTNFPKHHGIIGRRVLDTGGSLILGGESGGGKSLLSLELAISLRTKHNFLGLPLAKVSGILIMQTENSRPDVQERSRYMIRGLGLKKVPSGIFLSNPKESFDLLKGKVRSRIITDIIDNDIAVAIFDPFIKFHSKNENDNTEMRKVLTCLDSIRYQTDVAVILVHHFSKSEGRFGKYRMRGASTITDWADTIIELYRNHKNNERKINFLKARNGAGLDGTSIPLKLNQYLLHEVAQDQSKCTVDDVVRVLKMVFKGDCKKKGDLVNRLCKDKKCSEKTAANAIKKAIKKGTVKEIQDGKRKRIKLK